jgi:sugar lactone lactonase YvrE
VKLQLRLPRRSALFAVVALSLALLAACDEESAKVVERLFSPQGNQLDVYDLTTGESTVLIPASQNTVNGESCLLPDGSGNFLLGEDTGQEDGERQGWGIFEPDGTFVRKILEPETDNEPAQIEPFGCAFDGDDRLFVSDVGSGSFDATDGKLIVYFPPEYDTSCILDPSLRTAGGLVIDDDGSALVAESVPQGKILRFAPPFPASADECGSVARNKSTFIEDPDVQTPIGIIRAPNGNWYVSSVFIPPAIREYDANGEFVRTIAEGDDIGTPAGLALASDGTLYYADLAITAREGELPGPEPGAGTVRKITFDAEGNPSAPEIIGQGLDYPDAVSVLEVEE